MARDIDDGPGGGQKRASGRQGARRRRPRSPPNRAREAEASTAVRELLVDRFEDACLTTTLAGGHQRRSPEPVATAVSHLVALARAAESRVRVHLRYRDATDASSAREIDVLGIAFQDGRWYALAHCHLRHAVRLFRVERVVVARLTRRRACRFRLAGFDAAFFASVEYLEPGAPVSHLATIRLAGILARVAPALFPSAVLEREGRDQLCHVRVSDRPVLAALVRSLGPGASLERHGVASDVDRVD